MSSIIQDLRYALRLLAKTPGYTAVAVLTLAIGIGANTTIFSVVDGIWLRPLSIQDARGLVRITNRKVQPAEPGDGSSYPEYLDYRAQATAFSDIAVVEHRGALLMTADDTKGLMANVVSPNYFSMLGVRTAIGRTFSERELSVPDPAPIVILSYHAWHKYFGGDRRILDRPIKLSGQLCTVIGVLAPEVHGTDTLLDADVWMPYSTWTRRGSERQNNRDDRQFEMFGRLRPQQTLEQAQTQLQAISARLAHAYPATDSGRRLTANLEYQTRMPEGRKLGWLLLGISTLVLLIACANLSGLMIARGELRRREFATRLALGTGYLRLIRQSLTEGLLLAMAGSVCAVALAAWLIRALPALVPQELPLMLDLRLDMRVLLFTAGTALLSVLLAGTLPALRATRVAPIVAMKGLGACQRDRRWSLRNLVVIAQIAASLVLLTAGGLLLRTLLNVQRVNPGFDRNRNMLLLQIYPPGGGDELRQFYNEVIEQAQAVPGVQSAMVARRMPLASYGGGMKRLVTIPGREAEFGPQGLPIRCTDVGPSYFSTLGVTLLLGRAFTSGDTEGSPQVLMISAAFAGRFFPGESPVGKHLRAEGKDAEIVGVVEDGKYNSLAEQPEPYIYFPLAQHTSGELVLGVRTAGDPMSLASALKHKLHVLNNDLAIVDVRTLKDHMDSAVYEQRVTAGLVVTLGILGLLLANIGLYGAVSYMVNRRIHEIGIRMALGAERNRVVTWVLGYVLQLAGIGVAIGLVTALLVTRALSSLFYGVRPADPATLAGVVLLLLAVALLAALIPARRATQVDPMVALRYE